MNLPTSWDLSWVGILKMGAIGLLLVIALAVILILTDGSVQLRNALRREREQKRSDDEEEPDTERTGPSESPEQGQD